VCTTFYDVWTPHQPSDDRIALLAWACSCPIGQGIEASWSGLINGVLWYHRYRAFSTHDLRVRRGGEVKQLRGTLGLERPLPACRASQFLIHAATEATRRHACRKQWQRWRVAVVIGSALGGLRKLSVGMSSPGTCMRWPAPLTMGQRGN